MKKASIVLAVLFAMTPLFAGDLINKDSKRYDLEINTGGGGTTHTYISGNTNASGQARKGYTIKIKDNGSTIKVDFDGDVIIEKGQLKRK
jgi:hypothetical protein